MNTQNPSITIVTAQWNNTYTEQLYNGAILTLREQLIDEWFPFLGEQKTPGGPKISINSLSVPGALEIPWACQLATQKWQHNLLGLIVIGVVIQGETSHHTSVIHNAFTGVQQVALQAKIPVGYAILGVQNPAQAQERCGGAQGNAGSQAAKALLAQLKLSKDLGVLPF